MKQLTKAELKKDFKELCDLIISASLFWSGNDEEKNPDLKKARTLAGYYRAVLK